MIYAWAHVFLFGAALQLSAETTDFANFALPPGQSGSKFYDGRAGWVMSGGGAKCRMPNKRGPEINSRQANKNKKEAEK